MLGTAIPYHDVDWRQLVDENVEALRTSMVQQNLDAVLVGTMDNWRYLTGLPTNYTFAYANVYYALLVRDVALPYLMALDYVTGAMECLAARYKPITALPFPGTREARQPMDAGAWPAVIAQVTRDAGVGESRIGLDPGIPWRVKDALVQALPGADFVGAGECLRQARMLKNEQELNALRNACQIAEVALDEGLKHVRVGATEREIAGKIERSMRTSGAENSLSVPFVLSGDHPLLGYAYPSDKPLRNGEPIILDVGCSFGGYYSDLCASVYIGPPDQALEAAYEAVVKSLDAGLSRCTAGSTNVEVHEAMEHTLLDATSGKHQLGWFGGHACGLSVNEAPIIGARRAVEEIALRPGMFLCLEPGIHVPGRGLLCIEKDIIVAKGDPEVVTTFPYDVGAFRWQRAGSLGRF